jgi:hypothetical protein
MASDFDHIKNKMSEESNSVPHSLDWERMENGIFQKMQDIQESESGNYDKLKTIVFLLLCLLTICNRSQRIFLSPEYAYSIQNEPSPKNNTVTPKSTTPSINSENNAKLQTLNKQSTLKQMSKNRSFDALPTKSEQISKQSNFSAPKTIKNNLQKSLLKNKEQLVPISTPTTITSPLPNKVFFVENTSEEIAITDKTISVPQKNNTATPLKNRIHLSSGIGFWDNNFGNIIPEYASFEQTILSYYGALHFTREMKTNYFFSLGIQYQQLESRLDWTTMIEDYEIILEDTIKTIQNNLITGEVQTIRGDVSFNVNAQRNVRHFNKIQLYQVPLAVGKRWKFKNWESSIQIGAALNLASFYQGRTIQSGQVIELQKNSNPLIENQWKIHAIAGGQISYFLNNHIGISANIQYQRSLANWSKNSEVNMFPTILNLGLGMNYRF